MIDLDEFDLAGFLLESNHIERIDGVRRAEVDSAHDLLSQPVLTAPMIMALVDCHARGARLRSEEGMDVMVGRYYPPRGGPVVVETLESLMYAVNHVSEERTCPYIIHQGYETLHPFEDGNGRSGRLIWLWMHLRAGTYMDLGFLHQWYYESLLHFQGRC